ncbi:MAG: DNA recombination protein RmuC [Phycisphaerae bacterium]|nr:DNA recombination protein RmuC [Phycisphaerae bacterium]
MMLPIALTVACVLLVISLVACLLLYRQRAELAIQLHAALEEATGLDKALAVARQVHEHDEQQLEQFKQQVDKHLKVLTGEALKDSRDEFLKQAGERLKPITDLLRQYDTQYKKIEQSRSREYGSLKQVTESLQSQTDALVTALRRPEVRGRWGEIALRRLLELAGMTDRCDFSEQTTLDTEEGRLRPDLIVRLPNRRTVVIDSKVVLDAFLDAVHLPEGEERTARMRHHVQQIQEQVKRLSSKAYADHLGESPDFLVLFLPVESALYAATEVDRDLLERAMEKKVIIATPTVLLALLKAVEMGWREQQVADNARKIRDLGEQLHDRISKALQDVVRVGGSLEKTVRDYNTLVGSIDTRVMPSLRKFESTGAKSAREVPGSIEPIVTSPRQIRAVPEAAEAHD